LGCCRTFVCGLLINGGIIPAGVCSSGVSCRGCVFISVPGIPSLTPSACDDIGTGATPAMIGVAELSVANVGVSTTTGFACSTTDGTFGGGGITPAMIGGAEPSVAEVGRPTTTGFACSTADGTFGGASNQLPADGGLESSFFAGGSTKPTFPASSSVVDRQLTASVLCPWRSSEMGAMG